MELQTDFAWALTEVYAYSPLQVGFFSFVFHVHFETVPLDGLQRLVSISKSVSGRVNRKWFLVSWCQMSWMKTLAVSQFRVRVLGSFEVADVVALHEVLSQSPRSRSLLKNAVLKCVLVCSWFGVCVAGRVCVLLYSTMLCILYWQDTSIYWHHDN